MNFGKKQRNQELIERMGGKKQIIAQIVAIILAIVFLTGLDSYLVNKRRADMWIESYPMANQHIEWTYAGK